MQRLIPLLLIVLCCCKSNDPAPTSRTFRMGFQNSAPRYNDINLIVQSLNLWTSRSDAAMITTEVPWDSLIAGKNAGQYVVNNFLDLVKFYRSKNLPLWVYIDPANGLNRTTNSTALNNHGKSIADADMQLLYRNFVVAMDSVLHPDHLGLALETNLIRLLSPAAIYDGVKKAAAAAAADLRKKGTPAKLSISIQAEAAWGKLSAGNVYQGVATDLADFSFAEELGVSSYPYFNFAAPADIPDNYYSRLTEGTTLPLFVSEGGWSSAKPAGNVACTCTPQQQGDYFLRQQVLLNRAKAIAWIQLPFTDIDLTSITPGTDPSINYFVSLGLVDTQLKAKPSMASWDQVFALKLQP